MLASHHLIHNLSRKSSIPTRNRPHKYCFFLDTHFTSSGRTLSAPQIINRVPVSESPPPFRADSRLRKGNKKSKGEESKRTSESLDVSGSARPAPQTSTTRLRARPSRVSSRPCSRYLESSVKIKLVLEAGCLVLSVYPEALRLSLCLSLFLSGFF
jgi:hypothetical protein